MNSSFKGKVVFVTGAGRGIGRAIAEGFVSRGADVAVNSMTSKSLDSLLESLKSKRLLRRAATVGNRKQKILGLCGDASDELFAKNSIQEVVTEFGHLDILVNNVGIGFRGPTANMTGEEWDRIITTNLKSPFIWSKFFARHLFEKHKKGTIVNISSILGVTGRVESAAYCASKFGVIGLTKALADEWSPKGIRVNCVAPGTISTERISTIFKSGRWLTEEEYIKRIPAGRLGTVKEIANVVMFVASEEASYLHGSVVLADGGITAVS